MMKRGKFLVIEGADGTGKETQSKLLAARFEANNIPYVMFDFPQYETSFFGKLVGRFLKGEFGGLKEVSPYMASLTFAGDRWQAGPKIDHILESGTNVISNRYFLSNVAHQAAKLPRENRNDFINFLKEMEYSVYGIPKEDLNIVLHVPSEISQYLIEQKAQRSYLDGKIKDIHEADIGYQLEVAALYRDIPSLFPNVVGLECARNDKLMDRNEIHELIWGEVSRFLTVASPEGNSKGRERI
jgi:dTMP kinase